jgi:hypothetical protein
MSKIKTKMVFITSMLIVYGTIFSYGQNDCQVNKIYGAWRSIGSAGGYENVIGNVDSLRRTISLHSDPHIYQFGMDGTYSYSNNTINAKRPAFRKDLYTFEEKSCEIILGTKRKAYERSNLEILYVDGDYMIITNDNNPHGDYTTLYAKQ